MQRARSHRGILTLILISISAVGVGLGGPGDGQGSDAADAAQPEPAADTAKAQDVPAATPGPADSGKAFIRFNFKDAPYDQVLDFMARQSGLPVIREAEVPKAPVTFISASDYTLDEAMDVLNRMLLMHGVQLRREDKFLLLSKVEDMKALGPVGTDRVPEGAGAAEIVTVVVPLQNAAAAPTADQIKPLVSRFGAVTALPQQNMLVIVDTAAQCRRLRTIISRIDAEPPSDSKYQLFPIKHAKAQDVLGALKGLVAIKKSMVIIDKNGKQRTVEENEVQGLNLQADDRTNSIIAVGPDSRLRQVEQLIALLDQPESADSNRQLSTFTLASVAPSAAVQRVSKLYDDEPKEKRPTLIPLDDQGKMAVVGAPEQITRAGALLAQMDPGSHPSDEADPDGGSDNNLQAAIIKLEYVTPDQARGVLERLLPPRQRAVLRQAPTPDGRGLVVSGPAGDVELYRQLVKAVDTAPDVKRQVRQVKITSADPKAALKRATGLYALDDASKTHAVTSSFDAQTRSVTLVGDEQGLDRFTQVLRGVESSVTVDRETRMIGVEKSAPSRLAPRLTRLLRPMLDPGDGTPYVEPQVEPVDEARQLLVRAQPSQFAVIEHLVKTLDGGDKGDLGFRVLQAGSMDPKELADRAQQIYKTQAARIPGAGSVDVTIDAASNSLLVVADGDSMSRFTSIVDELRTKAGPTRQVRMLELRYAKADDVAAFLKDLLKSSKPFAAQGGPDPVWEPIEATNSLMVAAQPSQFSVIQSLVESLDSSKEGQRPPLRILRLRSTDAASLAQVLNETFNQRSAELKAQRPVHISADAATNTLIVSAHPDVFPEIQSIVDKLNETQAVNAEGREIRIFPLKVAQAEDLARTIDQMYPEPPVPRDSRGRLRPDLQPPREIVVRADPATNSLIVDAPVQRLAGFEQLVKQLDQQQVPENLEVRTYHVERAQLDAVANTLRQLAGTKVLTAGAPDAAGAQASISINTEPMSRTLIVSGPSEIFPEVEKVLDRLDAAPERPATGLKMYVLKHARAERIQPLLDRLLTARLREQQRTEGDAVVDVKSLLDVAADNATNTLIITAPEAIQPIAEQIIKTLDSPEASSGRAVVRVVPLTYAEASQTAATINKALPSMDLPAGGPVSVMATTGSNALLLSGAQADLDKVESLLESLDVRPVAHDAMDVVTFKLDNADAEKIASTVERLLTDQLENDPRIIQARLRYSRGQLSTVPRIRVEADKRTNSLVVSGPAATLELAKTIIERLDKPADEAARSARTFTPAKTDPQRLVQTVKPILDATFPQGPHPVELMAEPATGSVVVLGPDEQLDKAVDLLKKFDDEAVTAPEVQVQLFDMEHADATAVARSVQSMLGDTSRWPEALTAARRAGLTVASPTVNADRESNRLIVSAPSLLMPMARDLIKTFDKPAEKRSVDVRVFTLKKGEASSVATALRAGLSAGLSPGEPAPTVTPEPASNSIVVTATPARLDKAQQMIRSLDDSARPDGVAVRTIYLKNAAAENVAPVLESLLNQESVLDKLPSWERWRALRDEQNQPRIRAAAERRLNAVVVTGPVGLIDVAEQIVAELDVKASDKATAPTSRIRVITLDNARASDVAASIEAVFKEDSGAPVVRVDDASNSLVLRASDDQIESIEKLVSTLDKATLSSSRELRMIPVDRSRADAQMMAEALKRLLEQRSGSTVEIISVDDLLGGPKPDANKKPDEKKKSKRQSDATPLRRGAPGPPGPAGLLSRLVAASALAMPSGEATQTSGATEPVDDDGKITIAVDPATNSLIVVGSPRLADRVSSLAAELQRQMPAEPTRVRIVELPTTSDARSIAYVVGSMVRQIGRADADNPGGFTGPVSVQPDPAGGALIVSANETDFQSVGDLIRAMARPSASTSLTVKVYPLTNIDARRAANSVQDLVSANPRGRQSRRLLDITLDGAQGGHAKIEPGSVQVSADPSGRSLIVAAPADAIGLIDRFVAMLDQSPVNSGLAIRRFALTNARAEETSRTLQRVFDAEARGARSSGMPRATFVGDERTNSLLVTATADQLKEVDRLLGTLDAPMRDDKTQVAIIPLQIARPSTVRQIVEDIVVGRDPARKERVQITASDDSNLFVIRASEDDIAEVRKIVSQVDTAETTGLPVRSIKLDRADASTVADSLQQFFEQRARAAARPGQRREPPKVAIVGDRRTSTLVVAASDDDFAQIQSLVKTFDSPSPARDLQFKIIPLEHARVSEIRRAVSDMVDEVRYPPYFWVGRRNQAPPDTLIVEFDERSNSVIVMGQGESFGTVERIVHALDQPEKEGATLSVRSVRLEHADPSTVASAIQTATATPGWQWWRGRDPGAVQVEADRKAKTVVLIGREDRLKEAESYAEQLDKAAASPDQQISTIKLAYAAADTLARSLDRFYADRARQSGDTGVRPSFLGSPSGKVLIVSADKVQMATIQGLIAQMDQPDEQEGRVRELYHLSNANAGEMASTLREQFPSPRRGDTADAVIVTPQPSTNSIIVSAPKEIFDKVSALISQLDAPPSTKDTRIVTVALEAARADEVADALSRALPSAVKVTITPVPRTNSLMLTGSEEAIAVAMDQINKLDKQPHRSPVEFRRIKLEHALAYDVSYTLHQLLRDMPVSGDDPHPAVSYSQSENSLLIQATSEQLDAIEKMVSQLDVASLASQKTEFVPLKFADAEQTATALKVFYGPYASITTTPEAERVAVIAVPVSNSLVISADQKEWPGIRALIDKLDSAEYDTSRQLEIIALKHADAASLARAINEAFQAPLRAELQRQQARARNNQPRRRDEEGANVPTVLIDSDKTVSVTAEPLTNSLIVSARKEDMERIKAVVAKVDVPDFAELPEARIITVQGGVPSKIAATLREMYADQERTRGSGPRAVVIVGDDSSGTLIVRAEQDEFARIKAMADTLQQQADRSLARVRVLRLTGVSAGSLANTIRTTFAPTAAQRNEPLAVEVDRMANALVISSSERMFNEIKAVAEELDGLGAPPQPAGDGKNPGPVPAPGVFIIDVENNDPAQIKDLLEQMGVSKAQPADRMGIVSEPVTIVPLKSRRAIAVLASPRDGQTIIALVRSLDAKPAFEDQQVAIVHLSHAEASKVAAAMTNLLAPMQQNPQIGPAKALAEQIRRLNIQRDGVDKPDLKLDLSKPIRVMSEEQTNAVVIASTQSNVAALRQIADMLDRLPIGDAVTIRFFPLKHASADRLAGVIRDLFSQGEAIRQVPGSKITAEPTTQVGKALIGQIAVSVDERTNALIIAGREEAVALVEVMIDQLDADQTANWIEPVVIQLQHANAARMADQLTNVLIKGIKDTPEAAALQRQVARIRVLQAGGDPADPKSHVETDIFAPLSSLSIVPADNLNALIVVGSTENVTAVKSLVSMLDVPAAAAANSVRIYPLKFAAADRVAGMLKDVFGQQVKSGAIRQEDDLIIVPDVRTNSIVVSTSPSSFTVVEALLKRFDGERTDPLVGLHVIRVPDADVTALAPKIERLMRDRINAAATAGGVKSPSDTFSIQAEPASNSLIVAASDENLAIVRQLIDVLAKGAGETSGTQVVDIVSVGDMRAQDVSDTVQELYVQKETAKRGQDAVHVTANERLNALIVRGTQQDVNSIRTLVDQLREAPVTAVTEIKRIELTRADAGDVVRLLQNVLAGRPLSGGRAIGARQAQILRFLRQRQAKQMVKGDHKPTEAEISGAIQEQVTITPELRTNSVVVVAPAPLMKLIQDIVADLDTTTAGGRKIEVFRLRNADARAMRDVLRDLFNLSQQGESLVLVPGRSDQNVPPNGEQQQPSGEELYPTPDQRQQLAITIDARTNSLLVSATDEYLEKVRTVVQSLDSVEANEREQIVYELRNAPAGEVANTLRQYFQGEADTLRQVLGPERSGSLLRLLEREVTVQGDDSSQRLIVGVSPRYRDTIDRIVAELDSTPPQVMIQVMLAEVTLDSSADWGVDFSVGPLGGQDAKGSFLAAGAGVTTALGVPNLSVSTSDFSLLIRALEAQGRLEVLSRPQIMVNNNQPAHIQVGENIAIVEGVERLDNGNTRSDVTRKDVGIILNVTPSINTDGFVRMSIQPEISNVSNRTTQISEDFQAPIINTRQIDTNVTVKNGETIVIGGLIQNMLEKRDSKVPLLGDVPVLGEAFRSHQYNNVKTELLVILTPRVIRSADPKGLDALRHIRDQEINNLSIPGPIKKMLRENHMDNDWLNREDRWSPVKMHPAEDAADVSTPSDESPHDPMGPPAPQPADAPPRVSPIGPYAPGMEPGASDEPDTAGPAADTDRP